MTRSQEAHQAIARLRSAGAALQGLSADSRSIEPGNLFVAYPGFRVDGRRYISDAVTRGAAAVIWDVADGFMPPLDLPVPHLPAERVRELSGDLADELFGQPSARLWVAGVTGTNGKTTVSQWLARALALLGERCGVIGTLGSGFPEHLRPAVNTTPDAIAVHRTLAELLTQNAAAVTMEVSSIGLDQGRVNGVRFDAVLLTNLTRDHLDYHGSMENYAHAKSRLFDLPGAAVAVLNLDDAFGLTEARRLTEAGRDVIGYTRVASNADAVPAARVLIGEGVHDAGGGLRFTLRWGGERCEVQVRLVAAFNVSNLLAVAGALLSRGTSLDEVGRVLSRLTPPEGRMQVIGGVCEPLVVVDYAHTPDALSKVLEAVRETAQTRGGRLVCVFGCGGDRDPGKRPLMGEVARELADRVVLTSDNPRGEDPRTILAEIMAGVGEGAECIVDRAEAIARAIGEAAADDVGLIAGKGHESYQEVAGVRHPFSDAEQARQALAGRARRSGVGA